MKLLRGSSTEVGMQNDLEGLDLEARTILKIVNSKMSMLSLKCL